MTNSVAASLSTFVQSVVAIFSAVFDAILNVFYSFFALGQAVLTGVVHFGQSVLKRESRCFPSWRICMLIYTRLAVGLDVFQGVFGFVLGMSSLLPLITILISITPQPTFSCSRRSVGGIISTRRSRAGR